MCYNYKGASVLCCFLLSLYDDSDEYRVVVLNLGETTDQ